MVEELTIADMAAFPSRPQTADTMARPQTAETMATTGTNNVYEGKLHGYLQEHSDLVSAVRHV